MAGLCKVTLKMKAVECSSCEPWSTPLRDSGFPFALPPACDAAETSVSRDGSRWCSRGFQSWRQKPLGEEGRGGRQKAPGFLKRVAVPLPACLEILATRGKQPPSVRSHCGWFSVSCSRMSSSLKVTHSAEMANILRNKILVILRAESKSTQKN